MTDYRNSKGRDFNFYQKADVSNTDFGTAPDYKYDMIITFPTQTVIFTNEESSGVVEYSFNGYTVHGELDPSSPVNTKTMTFENRVISSIWFRVKSGSSGPLTVRVDAWATR